jgi:epsilon-lactone hydrolase
MASAAALEMMADLRANKKPPRPLAEERADWVAEAAAEPLPEGTVVMPAVTGGVSSEWITCGPVAETGMVLLLHGGGYRAGSPVTHRGFAARISRSTGLRVLLPDYRLAPEHPYPAAPEDAEAVFMALLDDGVKASEIVLLGDSAGGGLAITLMLRLKEAGTSQPAGAVLMSPWTDLECSGASYLTNIGLDPFMLRVDLLSAADDYRGGLPADDPMLSPIHADLSGLPKILIQAGGGEIMLDDAVVFAKRAQAAGCEAILDVTTEVWHVFQSCPDGIPEVHAAFGVVAEFVDWVLRWD